MYVALHALVAFIGDELVNDDRPKPRMYHPRVERNGRQAEFVEPLKVLLFYLTMRTLWILRSRNAFSCRYILRNTHQAWPLKL